MVQREDQITHDTPKISHITADDDGRVNLYSLERDLHLSVPTLLQQLLTVVLISWSSSAGGCLFYYHVVLLPELHESLPSLTLVWSIQMIDRLI